MKTFKKSPYRFSSILVACAVALIPVSASAASTDACTLLTPADAEAVLGEPVGPPRSQPQSGGQSEGSQCRFRASQGKALTAKALSVSFQRSTVDLSNSKPGIIDNLKSAGFKNVHEISGVGDSAVWATSSMLGRPTGELTVLKGKAIMLVILLSGLPDEAVSLERAKALAAKILPKL